MTYCVQCGEYTDNPKFCNGSCSAKFNNSKVPKRKKRTTPLCLNDCGNHTKRPESIYCSIGCAREHREKKVVESWLAGEWDGTRGVQYFMLSRTVRNYVIEQANYECSWCGYNDKHPETGEPILDVDHIDGDPTNNHPENLRVLCPNCHRKTITHGSHNIGNGKRPEHWNGMNWRKR